MLSQISRYTLQPLLILSLLMSVTVQAAIIPAAPAIGASGYILMDANSAHVIVSDNADEKLPPASLTKLMTAYIVESEIMAGRIAMSDTTTISEKAWGWGGSKMFVEVNTQVTIEDLLRGLIIQSGNDAAIALAEHIAGSEDAFAGMMNQYAAAMGMTNTHYVNASGWPHDDHYSTARDLAILAQKIVTDHAEFYPIYSEREFTYNKITQSNRNSLLWRAPNVDGLKTGHTSKAGYCLVASATEDGMRLISVVMGASSESAREQESLKLLSYGFRYFTTRELYTAATALNTSKVWAGLSDTIDLGLESNAIVTYPKGEDSQLKAQITIQPVIEAPIFIGDVLGTLVVTLDDKVVLERSLVALADIPEAGFFSRIWDYILLFFFNLMN